MPVKLNVGACVFNAYANVAQNLYIKEIVN